MIPEREQSIDARNRLSIRVRTQLHHFVKIRRTTLFIELETGIRIDKLQTRAESAVALDTAPFHARSETLQRVVGAEFAAQNHARSGLEHGQKCEPTSAADDIHKVGGDGARVSRVVHFYMNHGGIRGFSLPS